MAKSIGQLSKDLHITKQAIRQRMKHFKGFRYNHTRLINHRLTIDNKGVHMLKNYSNDSNYYRGYDSYSNNPLIAQLQSDLKHERIINGDLSHENKRLTYLVAQYGQSNQKLLKQTRHGFIWKLFH